MKVHGTHPLGAPRKVVFDAICDPATLLGILPGCEQIEQVSPTEYRGRMTLRLPGAVGSYRTSVRLVDVVAPERSGMEGRIDGAMGSIEGHAAFELAETADGTVLEYRGTGTIQGPLARLDSRFVERLAESLIAQGLKGLDARLAGEASRNAGPVTARPTTEDPA